MAASKIKTKNKSTAAVKLALLSEAKKLAAEPQKKNWLALLRGSGTDAAREVLAVVDAWIRGELDDNFRSVAALHRWLADRSTNVSLVSTNHFSTTLWDARRAHEKTEPQGESGWR